MTTKQIQQGGENSTNVQAGAVFISQVIGITEDEARRIALETFNSQLQNLQGIARDTAEGRVRDITDKIIIALKENNPKYLESVKDPDFIFTLETVQKEFARSGDPDVGCLLVDILINRTEVNKRTLEQAVLNESLAIAPKLTPELLAMISLLFIVRHVRYKRVVDLSGLLTRIAADINPFLEKIPSTFAYYQHLEYLGCATVSIGSVSFERILLNNYGGLFSKGLNERALSWVEKNNIATRICQRNPEALEIAIMDIHELRALAREKGMTAEERRVMERIYDESMIPEEKVGDEIAANAAIRRFVEIYNGSELMHTRLTSVGVAIGHANCRRKINMKADLSVWIH